MQQSVIGVGPYYGDFEFEIMSFRPYALWLYKYLKYDNFFVSSHYFSKFLYSWIPEENFMPVIDKRFSDDLQSQRKYYNDNINYTDNTKYIKEFRNRIFNSLINTNKENIQIFTPAYTKLADPVPIYKKLFKKISSDKPVEYKYIVVDETPWLDLGIREFNIHMLSSAKEQIDYLSNANCVVCRTGLWTLLANLQHVPVISYGVNLLSKFKQDGMFHFNNSMCTVFYAEDKHSVKDYIKRLVCQYLN